MIHVLLPGIHARPTGGNLYNRRILAPLSRLASVRRHFAVPSSFRTRKGNVGGRWLVDSLLIDAPIDGGILIAHYLHLIDPERRDSAEAEREREHLARYRAIVATSEYARRALADRPCIAIPPGLDDRYRTAVAPRRNRTPRLVTVANLFPGKGLLETLDLLESIRDLRWTWHLAGDASLDAEYARVFHERVARSPVAERVRVHGPLSPARVHALYDRADLFLLLTRFETSSMATREAMARALPVVAYRGGGLASNIPRATEHLLARANDSGAIAATLRRLLGDAEERAVAGRMNREAAMRFPTWDDAARDLRAFLDTMPESRS